MAKLRGKHYDVEERLKLCKDFADIRCGTCDKIDQAKIEVFNDFENEFLGVPHQSFNQRQIIFRKLKQKHYAKNR